MPSASTSKDSPIHAPAQNDDGFQRRRSHRRLIHAPAQATSGDGRGKEPLRISIAPAQVATNRRSKPYRLFKFQSTPPRGRPSTNRTRLGGTSNFNPRPAQGATRLSHGDHTNFYFNHAPARSDGQIGRCEITAISIHAPPRRGRPGPCRTDGISAKHFQSAPRRGLHGDPQEKWITAIFQSTPPAQGATYNRGSSSEAAYFNPRPRAWRRKGRTSVMRLTHFQSRPRATEEQGWKFTDEQIFQSTPPQGATGPQRCAGCAGRNFNPRPRAGGDAGDRGQPPQAALFQSTPPRRGATSAGAGAR